MSRKMMRVATALLLLVTFTAGAASAAPWSLAAGALEELPLAALWERIVEWWFRTPEPTAVWTEGCHMDPDGRCSGVTTNETDPND